MVGHQPATVEMIAMGARKSGRLTGMQHESISPTSVFDNYVKYAALAIPSYWRATVFSP